jgi:hypothetical protein
VPRGPVAVVSVGVAGPLLVDSRGVTGTVPVGILGQRLTRDARAGVPRSATQRVVITRHEANVLAASRRLMCMDVLSCRADGGARRISPINPTGPTKRDSPRVGGAHPSLANPVLDCSYVRSRADAQLRHLFVNGGIKVLLVET